MKAYKERLIKAIVEEATGSKIVSLREVANAAGINHIPQHDVLDILKSVKKALPDYRPVRMLTTPNDSLFCSLTFLDKSIVYEDAPEVTPDA